MTFAVHGLTKAIAAAWDTHTRTYLSFVYNIVQTKERHAHDQDVCE